MRRPSLRLAFVLPILVAAHGSNPARADLYKLDGQFQCLEQPDAVCHDATPIPADKPAAKAVATVARSEPADTASVAAPAAVRAEADQPGDPIAEIARRIQGGKPATDDVPMLRHYAKSGRAAAIELLAWCALKGIGTRRDPVEAYILYGAAASADVRGARENQSVIYARELSSQQRQQVAEVENQLLPAPAPSSYAAVPQE